MTVLEFAETAHFAAAAAASTQATAETAEGTGSADVAPVKMNRHRAEHCLLRPRWCRRMGRSV